MLMPTIADSEIGVSRTRASPNSAASPCVTPNAPPYEPTSSPRTNTFGSRRISSASASRIASRYVSSLLIPAPLHHEGTKLPEAHEVPSAQHVLREPSALRAFVMIDLGIEIGDCVLRIRLRRIHRELHGFIDGG